VALLTMMYQHNLGQEAYAHRYSQATYPVSFAHSSLQSTGKTTHHAPLVRTVYWYRRTLSRRVRAGSQVANGSRLKRSKTDSPSFHSSTGRFKRKPTKFFLIIISNRLLVLAITQLRMGRGYQSSLWADGDRRRLTSDSPKTSRLSSAALLKIPSLVKA
jgi:hypothetical protein